MFISTSSGRKPCVLPNVMPASLLYCIAVAFGGVWEQAKGYIEQTVSKPVYVYGSVDPIGPVGPIHPIWFAWFSVRIRICLFIWGLDMKTHAMRNAIICKCQDISVGGMVCRDCQVCQVHSFVASCKQCLNKHTGVNSTLKFWTVFFHQRNFELYNVKGGLITPPIRAPFCRQQRGLDSCIRANFRHDDSHHFV